MASKMAFSLIFVSLVVSSVAKSIPDTRNPCNGQTYCENVAVYPGDLILSLLRNTTIPRGLFDVAPTKKRSVDLMNLITKDIANFLTKEKSDTGEMSNYIDDLPVTSKPEETTTEVEDVFSDFHVNETMLV
eukprot:TRINITY_DN34975_c0_g1_i1.p1 TRINITY_DN34975_c0_g1~~TRINITY_DN34975_c0_g1_i1.p1  ORF type:complete len:131 (-),score=25.09 TRINITY_DN34975_c0_g1_i1:81-473(-)